MNFKLISAVAVALLSAAPAFSATVTLDFEGATSFQSINDFYNGGTDGDGASGADLGVSFDGDALALSNDALNLYYSNAPTSGTVMTAVGDDAALNVADGFIGQLSFYYSSTESSSVSLYSGLNGTGSLVGTITLDANAQTGGCSDSALCYWSLATLDFTGVAQSIQFGSAKYVAAFDNVTLTPVPLPAAAWLLISGLGGLGTLVRRKKIA